MTPTPASTSTPTFDGATQLAAVSRSVRMQELDGHDGVVITLTQTFAAKRSALWSAATEIARLAQWFAPVDGSLRRDPRVVRLRQRTQHRELRLRRQCQRRDGRGHGGGIGLGKGRRRLGRGSGQRQRQQRGRRCHCARFRRDVRQ